MDLNQNYPNTNIEMVPRSSEDDLNSNKTGPALNSQDYIPKEYNNPDFQQNSIPQDPNNPDYRPQDTPAYSILSKMCLISNGYYSIFICHHRNYSTKL